MRPGAFFYFVNTFKQQSWMTNKILNILMLVLMAAFAASCSNDDGDVTGGGSSVNLNRNLVADEPAVARLEFPRLKEGNNVVIVYRTSDNKSYDADRVNFAVEWDCDKKAQRWSCYQMHKGYTGTYSRVVDGYMNDTGNLAPGTYWDEDYYYGSGYEHGHICPNADRKYSFMANYQTFYLTNMQPQYHRFNGYTSTGADRGEGLWVRMEEQVRSWTPRASTDTLYVCKGGTIDSEDNIIERVQGKLIVPRYFFMALLMKNEYGYRALAFWAEQKKDDWQADEPLSAYVITIDELEEKTGIDFFCNLPDETEEYVENHYSLKAWGLE